MAKEQNRTQKPTSFRFKPIVHDVLDEIAKTDIPGFPFDGAKNVKKPISKTGIIESCLSLYCVMSLGGYISECQLNSVVGEGHDQIYRLFVKVCRAERGEEGYGYTTKNRKTRFVYGPGDPVMVRVTHWFGKVPKRGRKSK